MFIPVMLRRSFFVVLAVVCITLLMPRAGFAEFNDSNYGTCSYSSDCTNTMATGTQATSNSSQQTIMSLDNGLDVAVNLHDGQLLPVGGYTVVVTPLNGQGSTFKTASFYISEKLAGSAVPDTTGTAKWFWDPHAFRGTQITISIVGQSNTPLTKVFTIRFGSSETSNVASTSTSVNNPTAHGIQQHIRVFLHTIPKNIVYSFPYLLFVLLGCLTFFLLMGTYRETLEAESLRKRLKQAQEIRSMKDTFIALTSHYLRTPLTILSSAFEIYRKEAPDTSATIQDTLRRINSTVDGLIAISKDTSRTSIAATSSRVWLRPSFCLPVSLVCCIAFSFDLLVSRIGNFSLGVINLLTQIIAYGIAVTLFYLVIRYRILRQQDGVQTQQILAQLQDLNMNREIIVEQTTTALDKDLQTLSSLLARRSPSSSLQFMKQGEAQLRSIINHCNMASRLRGARSQKSYQVIDGSIFIQESLQKLQTSIADKAIVIDTTPELPFYVQDPFLFRFVVFTVLDNAIAYSKKNGQIRIYQKRTVNEDIIFIQDNGAGMNPQFMDAILEPFSKYEGAETFNHAGMGLSLYLDRLIMTYLGGVITIESKPGKGTTVRIVLPSQQSLESQQYESLEHEQPLRMTAGTVTVD